MMINNRWAFLAAAAAIFLASCSSSSQISSEEPMYGGRTRNTQQIKADSEYIDPLVAEIGNKDEVLKKILEEAWGYQKRGYFELAMRRFNQAWILNPQSSEVYDGFGVLLHIQGKTEKADALYQKALSLDSKNAMAAAHQGRLYQEKALALSSGFMPKHKESAQFFQKALESYEKASRMTEDSEKLSFVYYQWAVALAVNRDYRGAWEKVHLSKKHGGEFIEQEFLSRLSQDMPEPFTG